METTIARIVVRSVETVSTTVKVEITIEFPLFAGALESGKPGVLFQSSERI
jgi:hypothetical protein